MKNYFEKEKPELSMQELSRVASSKLSSDLEWKNFNPEWIKKVKQVLSEIKKAFEKMREESNPDKRLLATIFLSALESAENGISDEMNEDEMNAILMPLKEKFMVMDISLRIKD